MVTNWNYHWDKLTKSPYFTLPLIHKEDFKAGPWPDRAKTLFIKLDDNDKFERSWLGFAGNFRSVDKGNSKTISFEVFDLIEMDCAEELKNLKSGWYEYPDNETVNLELEPPFFQKMEDCSWIDFEAYCFLLLRLLGVHNLHRHPQDDNRGRADGFFTFGTLSVVYDATTNPEFEKKKGTQIDNYVAQIKQDKIQISVKEYDIAKTQKQVWIINRSKVVRVIKTSDDITVKCIPYSKLIEIYHYRLGYEVNLNKLCTMLSNL